MPEQPSRAALNAWFTTCDLVAARDENRRLRTALQNLLDRYTALVNCGDCGNWDPEEEQVVIAARRALATQD